MTLKSLYILEHIKTLDKRIQLPQRSLDCKMSPPQDDYRFEKKYGIPADRPHIATVSLEHHYCVEKVLDPGAKVGALNLGVFLVRHRTTGKLQVQKKIPFSQDLEREILVLQVLRHPYVVGFVDAFITNDTFPPQLSLYMEYCDLGSMQDLIKRYVKHNGTSHGSPAYLPEVFILHSLHSLASALQYLHHGIEVNDRRDPPVPRSITEWPTILHRDIKPDNILLRTPPAEYPPATQPSIYPHWPFNQHDLLGSIRTFPKVVLADFVSFPLR